MANLERYFPIVKTSSSLKQKDLKKSASRYTPYKAPAPRTDVKRPSDAALNRFLLSTLKDENNPITHSTSGLRAEHVESTATGHQRSDSVMNRTLYLKHRREKLKNQEERPAPSTSASSSSLKFSSGMQSSTSTPSTLPATSSSSSTLEGDEPPKTKRLVMQGVRVYINGYLCDTTDIEMKRTVTLAGGQVLLTPSNATHVLTSQGLNGSKTHKHLTKNPRNKVHIVKPEWVVDSINVGKRLPERHYTVVVNHTMNSVATMFGERPYERPLPPSP